MVTIDLAKLPVRNANELIRKHGAAGEDVEVINPDARHHIGVGLISPIKVKIRGSAGYFCAGLTDQAHFEVDNNVGWGPTSSSSVCAGVCILVCHTRK